jgi:uncharacterized protein (TIGR02186 family)
MTQVRKKLKKRGGFFPLLLYFCTLASFPQISYSRPIIADLSLRQIEIDSGFTGTDILLFGARTDPGDIVIVVRGPETSYIVRKKERVAGIWVNKKQHIFQDINDFYAIASNRPLENIQNDYLLSSLRIGEGDTSLPPDESNGHNNNIGEFKKALLKRKQDEKLYMTKISEVSFMGDTLFRTVINFPENITRGVYTAEIYLFSDGQLSGVQSTPIIVSKKGFDAYVYDFAYKYPAIYGIISVLIALFAGWLAGIFFKKV